MLDAAVRAHASRRSALPVAVLLVGVALACWRPGTRGALLMGTRHGAYCAGCCVGLMAILFVLGVMSITWMLVVSGVVFGQKALPFGDRLRLPLSAALVGLGAWIAVDAGS